MAKKVRRVILIKDTFGEKEIAKIKRYKNYPVLSLTLTKHPGPEFLKLMPGLEELELYRFRQVTKNQSFNKAYSQTLTIAGIASTLSIDDKSTSPGYPHFIDEVAFTEPYHIHKPEIHFLSSQRRIPLEISQIQD